MKKLAVAYVRVDALTPYAKNARTHSEAQVGQIAQSIRKFGWTNPILVDGGKGIIAGHGRLMAAKGRNARGERSPSAVLSESQVLEIAAAEGSYAAIAARFGITVQHVRQIKYRSRWRHLEVPEVKRNGRGRFAKFSPEVVRAIAASNEPTMVLAARFGVCRQTVRNIKRGITYSNFLAEGVA